MQRPKKQQPVPFVQCEHVAANKSLNASNHRRPKLSLTRLGRWEEGRCMVQTLIVAFPPRSTVAMSYLLSETWWAFVERERVSMSPSLSGAGRTIAEMRPPAIANISVSKCCRKHKRQIPVCSSSWISRCVIVSLTIAAPNVEADSVAAPPLMKGTGVLHHPPGVHFRKPRIA